jgi:hypothetical protein
MGGNPSVSSRMKKMTFIEHFWCGAKWYTRENCEYSLEGIRKTVPLAVHSISSSSINSYYHRCMRVLKAYEDGLTYGTVEFNRLCMVVIVGLLIRQNGSLA